MKINKWLVVAVLAVVLIGGVYGGLSYVENRVVAAVRDTIGKMDNASVGSVSFSLPDRKLVITDVAVQLLQDSLFAHSAKIKSVEAVLPWSMILSSKPKAGVFVIDTVNTQGIEYTTRDGTISIARDRARDVHIDLATLEQFLFKKEAEAADMLARYERNNLGRAESEGIVLSVLGEGVRLEIANSVVERMNGLRIGSLRSTGIAVFVAEPQAVPEKVLEVASFSMGNVDLPVDALRLALELQTPPSHEQLDAWMRSLFAGKEPLVGRFTVRDCKLAENIFRVRFRSCDRDWSSGAPRRYKAT
ncbi:MAG: hypothetical protein LBC10_04925, partial [Deltaproteobacteria bacterium]|nr:hypothetical protein [Deltaproteobacteria bacterium]